MSINIRYPNITGHTEADQLMQIKSFLHQLVEQLNWALSFNEAGSSSANSASTQNPGGDVSAESFYELKSLIIKSTDMLNAYYDKINKKLEGQYVTQADFDAYKAEPKYVLPIGGATIGGVKNGGNVTIEKDGTMNVDVPSDEHINELIDAFYAEASEEMNRKYVSHEAFEAYKAETAGILSDEHITELINSILANNESGTD